jgi:hypothetical protein
VSTRIEVRRHQLEDVQVIQIGSRSKSHPTRHRVGGSGGCHCGSAMGNLALETPRYCLVAFVGTTSGSASNGDGSPGESILEALNESGESDV